MTRKKKNKNNIHNNGFTCVLYYTDIVGNVMNALTMYMQEDNQVSRSDHSGHDQRLPSPFVLIHSTLSWQTLESYKWFIL